MKTLLLLFALSLYLLLPNPTHSTRNPIRLPTADIVVASDTPVRDTNGNEVRTSGAYYIVSASSETPEKVGLGWYNDTNTRCPTNVVLWKSEGFAIKMTPEDQEATVVLESTSLYFKFDTRVVPPCDKLTWGLLFDSNIGRGIVKTGDVITYRFKILRDQAPNTYRIIFCPNPYVRFCYNVSTYYDKSIGETRLVLGDGDDSPLIVKFEYLLG